MDASTKDKLDAGLRRIFRIDADQPGVHLDAVRAKAAANLAAYGRVLAQLFQRQSVPIPPPIHLQWWPEGSRIRLVGEHTDRERIEVILNGDGEIVEEFKELELLHEIVRITENAGADAFDAHVFNIGITSSGPVAFFTT